MALRHYDESVVIGHERQREEQALASVELVVRLRKSQQMSAKKNLFLETGWYRPHLRIPVAEKRFLL